MDEFEYDEAKSRSNLDKHGIDFFEAQALWLDPKILELQVTSEGEIRFVVIGMIKGKHWSAVVTYRGEKIRLISVRRSRKNEVSLYES
jgi:uncharacterized DUF497 family protein